jgi:hypothetical protein
MTNKYNMKYIVVHSTGTNIRQTVDPTKLPYHFIITLSGRLLNLNQVDAKSGCVDVAYVGGIDKKGNVQDTRTSIQCDCMFNTIVLLSEQFPEARIVGADELYGSKEYLGFNVKEWLHEFIPSMLLAA